MQRDDQDEAAHVHAVLLKDRSLEPDGKVQLSFGSFLLNCAFLCRNVIVSVSV